MSTPMLNNFLAAFKGAEPSPLYGKSLVYLTGSSSANFRAIPGSVVEPPQGSNVIGTEDKIAYCNLRDHHIEAAFTLARSLGYKFAELDNLDTHGLGDTMEIITQAHSCGLGIIVKNPFNTKGPLQLLSHGNVFGVIAERGTAGPESYDSLRQHARKAGKLPVWFVFEGCDGAAHQCAAMIRAGKFAGMGVTYSTGRYNDSHTVLLPII